MKQLRWSRIGIFSLLYVASLTLPFSGDKTSAQPTLKGDAKAGKAKAQLCAACHGTQGISINALWPNLAGQHEQYLFNQIIAFRDGARAEATMQPFVNNLSDQDAADLAAYYAGLSPCP